MWKTDAGSLSSPEASIISILVEFLQLTESELSLCVKGIGLPIRGLDSSQHIQ